MLHAPTSRHLTGVLVQAARALLAFTLFTLAAVSQVRAADGEPPGYRQMIDEAVAEFEAQNYPEARALFVEAHQLFPNARTFRGLGVVAFELREYAASMTLLEQALASPLRRLEERLRLDTERLLARARRFVGQIDLTVTPAEAEIMLDGKKLALRPGTPLRLDVGTHRFEFLARGFETEQREKEVLGGEHETWVIALRPAKEALPEASARSSTAPPQAATTNGAQPLATLKWIGLATTVAAAGVTGSAIGMRDKRAREFNNCPEGYACLRHRESAHAWRNAAIGTGAATAALVGATIALFVLDGRDRPHSIERALRVCNLGPFEVGCRLSF